MHINNPSLWKQAFRGLAFFVIALAVLIFLPALTPTFWQGWLYWAISVVSCVVITVYFLEHDPKLIESRLSAGPKAEKEKKQKSIQTFLSLAFVALFVGPGIDHALGWSSVPPAVVLIADLVVVAGFAIIFWTFKMNGYASSIVEILPGQRVISSGPYAAVRHPMYSGAALLLLATPVALGSWWSLIFFVPALIGIALRLQDEESFLVKNLPGYAEYRERTGYRLVPLVW